MALIVEIGLRSARNKNTGFKLLKSVGCVNVGYVNAGGYHRAFGVFKKGSNPDGAVATQLIEELHVEMKKVDKAGQYFWVQDVFKKT